MIIIKNRFVSIVVLLSVIVFISVSSVERTGSDKRIWIEAEDANKIVPPLEIIECSEASGGKALISRLESHQTESYAAFDFTTSLAE